MKNRLLLASVLILILLSIEACVPSKPEYEERILTSTRLIKKLEANRRAIKTFNAVGTMDVDSKDFGGSATFEVTLKKPDTIKVNIYGPFGIDLAEAVVTNRNFIFYDVMNNKVYKGMNSQSALKEIFKVDFTFEELMDAFAGSVNLTEKLRREPDIYNVYDDTYELIYVDDDLRKNIYVINQADLAITSFKITDSSGKNSLLGKYVRFQNYNDVPVPQESEIINYEMDQSIRLKYKSIDINSEPKEFTINYPSDAEIIEL